MNNDSLSIKNELQKMNDLIKECEDKIHALARKEGQIEFLLSEYLRTKSDKVRDEIIALKMER